MFILHGDTPSIKSKSWRILELRNELTAEGVLRRIAEEAPAIFRDSPMELFAPVARRDCGVYELATGAYVFVRSDNFRALLRLKTVTGVAGLLTESDSGRSSDTLTVDDGYVQDLADKDQRDFEQRSAGIGVGSFVRILDGEVRDFCGTVAEIEQDRATVVVELLTKKLIVRSPVHNLLNLDCVAKGKRVFFFSPLVDELQEADLLVPFLHTTVPPTFTEAERGETENAGKPGSRESNITLLLRREAQLGRTPREMLAACVAGLRSGAVPCRPKNLAIVFSTLRVEFLAANKQHKNWRAVRHMIPGDAVTLEDVWAACETAKLGIPRETPADLVAQDRRSRAKRRA